MNPKKSNLSLRRKDMTIEDTGREREGVGGRIATSPDTAGKTPTQRRISPPDTEGTTRKVVRSGRDPERGPGGHRGHSTGGTTRRYPR